METRTRVRKLRLTTGDGKILLEEEINLTEVSTSDLDALMELFRIISSESRYRVIRFLAEKQTSSFKELCSTLGYSQKTIAQCLDDLLRINAITKKPEGYTLSVLGKLMISQLREMAGILRKLKELEELTMEFE
ncbi:ArsR family transcriptional regulator [Candidatus Bathyarchaeota archaeon]|nr:MAG: ArsR family transcriptional regulator [Candidatus Bathyarchaeota archaeon]